MSAPASAGPRSAHHDFHHVSFTDSLAILMKRVATALLFATTIGTPSTGRAEEPPRSTYGMNLRVLSAEQADKMVELGASTARIVLGWDVIEPAC